jgi:hypothetical protein
MFKIDGVITQSDDNTKCEGKVITHSGDNKYVNIWPHDNTKRATYDIIQTDDSINVMIWLGDNIAIVISNYMAD